MNTDDNRLAKIARSLVAPGKGILAADESTSTIGSRLREVGVESSAATRCAYRRMLFSTDGLDEFISGVILFDETFRQSCPDGGLLREMISERGMMAGIKVDGGTTALARFPGETVTRGIDGLRERLREYREMGAKFTKWRAVLHVGGDALPTGPCIRANAYLLARFASLSQEQGLVPIVEPEVLMDGVHSIERCFDVTEETLRAVFDALGDYRVTPEAMLLKPSMVIAGKYSPRQAGVDEVAEMTLACLRRTVPAAVPGIVFLSGGQEDITATRHLQAMNAIGGAPWELSFSYGRALQAPALAAWRGAAGNEDAAREVLLHRARCNSLARSGKYSDAAEEESRLAASC